MSRDTGWFKSSNSSSGSESCVEVRLADSIGVRDSKNRNGGALWLPPTAWAAFLATAPMVRPVVRRQ
ncbi:MAG TPA: DUF397 domain-containing protein [Pseudonocardiaceae bacterium]